ncbi:MAG: M28 family metallopeptidase [Candidatus Aminicenantes bacterium]|nr:M28 family metallopeptidase [Candidatus Aminicenantes bacterium]
MTRIRNVLHAFSSGRLQARLFLAVLSLALIFPACTKEVKEAPDPIAAYKDFIDSSVSPEKIDSSLKHFCADPHVASSTRNNTLAAFIRDEWTALGLEDVHLAHYDVLLSFPEDIRVELVSPKRIALGLKEEPFPEDPDTQREDVGIPYNAYSQSGDISSKLVYANSGNPGDYDLLESKGLDLKGKIALVRYSSPYSYRGFKAYTAEKRGLAGLLIYSDPKEDGFARGEVFPRGPWGPMSHIQRGGIPYDFLYPGDPLTPGWASTRDSERLPREQAESLPHIISVPLSARDALPLLEVIGGEKAPEAWVGALPVTYRLGGSNALVRMQVKMTNPVKKITNVIGYIRGSDASRALILAGNHRDAWVFGGHDPSSGTAALMELARAFAEAKKKGFQPKRSICFASWDAEEFTLTGSTEWGEDNRDLLKENLVAYLNVDSSASGRNFSVQAVPSLNPLILCALKEVKDPLSQDTLYESQLKRPNPEDSAASASEIDLVEPIGSGTDHAVFLNHIGAPSLDMTFSGDYGVYHSMYDNYFWMSHFGDPGMLYTAALTKVWAHMIIDLSCQTFLPLDYASCAQKMSAYLQEWSKQYDPEKTKSRHLSGLLEEMKTWAARLNALLSRAERMNGKDIQSINRCLIQVERDFTITEGIPKRPWYKHLVFGARYTYAVLLLPELTETAEAGDSSGIQHALEHLEAATERAIAHLKEAVAIMDKGTTPSGKQP